MDAAFPDKTLVLRLATLVEFGLLGPEHLVPWAEEWVRKLDSPPLWLLDLCTARDAPEVAGILSHQAFAPPREAFGAEEFPDNSVACLFLCHRRKDFAWLDFLLKAGDVLDRSMGPRDCASIYLLANALEQSTNPEELEQAQRVHIEREFQVGIERMETLYRSFSR